MTWGHLPVWLNTDHPKLNIVKHEDYIPDKYLPVFSSIPIELNLHRIDDLAECFIIANDDIYFLDKVDREYFFQGELPCDYLMLQPITEIGSSGFGHFLWENISCINRNFNMRECMKANEQKWFSEVYPQKIIDCNRSLSRHLNYFPGFAWDHLFMPVRKTTFEIIWRKEYQLLDYTCSNKFRNLTDCTNQLIRYWQLVTGQFIPFSRPNAVCVKACAAPTVLRDGILSLKNKMICVNEGMEDVDYMYRSQYLRDLFEIRLPEMSDFEKF